MELEHAPSALGDIVWTSRGWSIWRSRAGAAGEPRAYSLIDDSGSVVMRFGIVENARLLWRIHRPVDSAGRLITEGGPALQAVSEWLHDRAEDILTPRQFRAFHSSA
jgi:hypothetical protein